MDHNPQEQISEPNQKLRTDQLLVALSALLGGIVPGQRLFRPDQMRRILGGISRGSYTSLINSGRLKYCYLMEGKVRVHTQKMLDDYLALLDSESVSNGGLRLASPRRSRRLRS